MHNTPLTISHYPRAILHIDGDAFFASCEQSRDPRLRHKPVVTGKERGIASSMSYEAKAKGVTRGMRLYDIKKICPEAIILPSDYETYSLLSKRLFSIVRRYTPDVEEYSIDECFADITGLQRPLGMSYENIATSIKNDLDNELGFTFSVGLAPSKVIGKIASKWKKPSGFTDIPGRDIHHFLAKVSIDKVWGIGQQTTAFLHKHGVKTALELATKSSEWIKHYLTKPFYEIWQELNGRAVLAVDPNPKEDYSSIMKSKTFTPPSSNREFVFSQLSKNVESACIKARRYKLATKEVIFFLKRQDFRGAAIEVKLSDATNMPIDIVEALRPSFNMLFKRNVLYRATGVTLGKLDEDTELQPDLFGKHIKAKNMKKVFDSIDGIKNKYGKHSVCLGSSYMANKYSQHAGSRGNVAQRKMDLFKGEDARKRLAVPMLCSNQFVTKGGAL
jgi:DNA polymerase IV